MQILRVKVTQTYAFRQQALVQKIILSHLPSRMDMYIRVPTGSKYCSIRGHTFLGLQSDSLTFLS